MPDIIVTFGTKSYKHTVSAGDATRILNAVAANRGVTATADAVCPILAREFFQNLKNETIRREVNAAAVVDIPATGS